MARTDDRDGRDFLEATVVNNPWIPQTPWPKQALYLQNLREEVLFGGAAGGGKTDGMLMSALQFADWPGYRAVIFRRTFQDLALPEAIMNRAHEWLRDKAHWNADTKTYTFPRKDKESPATLTFAYLEHEPDKYRYQGAAFHFLGFDELTQLWESAYTYLFSRVRKKANSPIPLRVRSTSNPGGIGHDWVMNRFMVEEHPDRQFIPAKLADNPSLDRAAYEKSLSHLDPYTRKQLLEGDWFARPPGELFRADWFPIVGQAPLGGRYVRRWDLASTEVSMNNRDPDWTVGALLTEKRGRYWVTDVVRFRGRPEAVQSRVRQTAESDGRGVQIWIEQEPGSSGIALVDHYRRDVLKGWDVRAGRTTGSKELRANPVSAAAEAGNVLLVRGSWNKAFLDEFEAFPSGSHDDQVDAVSGAVETLAASHTLTGNRTAVSGERTILQYVPR